MNNGPVHGYRPPSTITSSLNKKAPQHAACKQTNSFVFVFSLIFHTALKSAVYSGVYVSPPEKNNNGRGDRYDHCRENNKKNKELTQACLDIDNRSTVAAGS